MLDNVKAEALGTNSNIYGKLYRVLFWLAVLIAVVLIAHAALILISSFFTQRLPNVLHFPRPELMVVLFAVPAIASAASNCFGGDGGDIVAGVTLAVILPLVCLVLGAAFIARMLHNQKFQKAGFVITPEHEEREPGRFTRGFRAFQALLVGRESPEGFWRTIRKPDSRFVYKWGALFEETRGPPMLVHGATWEAHPVTGFVNRGRLIPVPGAPLLSVRGWSLYMYHLQAYAGLVDVLKVTVAALLTNAIQSNNSMAQVVLLLLLCLTQLLYLRLCQPLFERQALIISMASILFEAGVFVCGVVLVALDNASATTKTHVGIAMLVLAGVGFLINIIQIGLTIFGLFVAIVLPYLPWRRIPADEKFAKAVHKVMERDPHILARKFADRWLRKVLNEGLYGRPLQRVEVPQDQPLLRAMTLGVYHRSAASKRKSQAQWGKLAAAVHLANMQSSSHAHNGDINVTPEGRIPSSTAPGLVLPPSSHSSKPSGFHSSPSKRPGWGSPAGSPHADGGKDDLGSMPMLHSLPGEDSPNGSGEHIGTFQDPDFSTAGAPERTMSAADKEREYSRQLSAQASGLSSPSPPTGYPSPGSSRTASAHAQELIRRLQPHAQPHARPPSRLAAGQAGPEPIPESPSAASAQTNDSVPTASGGPRRLLGLMRPRQPRPDGRGLVQRQNPFSDDSSIV